MENTDKIYSAKHSLAGECEKFVNLAKTFFLQILPLAKILFLFGLTGFILLVLQISVIGIFDRLGVSPKITLLISSLIYAVGFAVFALIGGLKNSISTKSVETNFINRPICKILFIKRKSQVLSNQAKVETDKN
jgi:hypothetical protein